MPYSPTASLLSPDNTWGLWAVLLSAAAFGMWAERTRWGARVSGAVLTIGATFVLSNISLIPAAAPTYDVVWSYFVPLAIPLLLLRANLRRIIREAGFTLVAFAVGAVGTVLGTIVAFYTVPVGEEAAKLAGIFCATYVGGSMNYVATAEVLDLRSGDLLAAGVAADNLVMTLYFLVLFALPSMGWIRRHYSHRIQANGEQSEPLVSEETVGVRLHLHQTAAALAYSAILCAIGYGVAAWIGVGSVAILIITAVAVALATFFPERLSNLSGGHEVGVLLMMVFFAVIGASANIGVVLREGPILFVFAGVILTIHLAVILLAGRLLRLDIAEIVIASNANMGGPTTAAAMASARGWGQLVTPAILVGTLGYAIATFVGAAVGSWLR